MNICFLMLREAARDLLFLFDFRIHLPEIEAQIWSSWTVDLGEWKSWSNGAHSYEYLSAMFLVKKSIQKHYFKLRTRDIA